MKALTTNQVEKIARNINAMDLFYCYADDNRKYKFWSNLERKLYKILNALNEVDRMAVKALCQEKKASYFGL